MADNARLLAVRGLLKVLPAEGGGKSLREVLAEQPVLLAAERIENERTKPNER